VGHRGPIRWGQFRALNRCAGYDSPLDIALLCAVVAIAACTLHAAPITLSGHVVDEDASPVGGARLTIRAAGGTAAAAIQRKQANPTGAFAIELPGPGDYRVSVEREGYYELKDYPVRLDNSQEVTLAVNTIREVFQSIDINAEP